MENPTLSIPKAPSGDTQNAAQILDLMELVASFPEGLGRLVDRYAALEDPLMIRVLTFLFARTASRQSSSVQLAPILWRLLNGLRSYDDWVCINILSALQLVSMHEAPVEEVPTDRLFTILLDSLARPAHVQGSAVAAIARLHADGMLSGLSVHQTVLLKERTQALLDSPDELVRMELESLGPFLEGSLAELEQAGDPPPPEHPK